MGKTIKHYLLKLFFSKKSIFLVKMLYLGYNFLNLQIDHILRRLCNMYMCI